MEDKGEIVIYQTQDGTTQLDVRLDGETVWITQEQMAQLFQRDKSTISRHLRHIFDEGELDEALVVAKIATPKKYGRREGFMFPIGILVNFGTERRAQIERFHYADNKLYVF